MAWTLSDLEALEAALLGGYTSVSYEGKTVSYRSIQDMLLIRAIIKKELGLLPASRTFVAAHDPGFRPGGDGGGE